MRSGADGEAADLEVDGTKDEVTDDEVDGGVMRLKLPCLRCFRRRDSELPPETTMEVSDEAIGSKKSAALEER